MDVYRPLRALLFAYELIRLVIMIGLMAFFMPPPGEGGGILFPYQALAAPNALFPLITFFLCLRPDFYRPYIFLFAAGKVVLIAAAAGWLYFSFSSIMSFPNDDQFIILGCLLFLTAADVLSILGGLALNRGVLRLPPPAGESGTGAEALYPAGISRDGGV
jgi:hypothetical protein